MGLIHEVGVKTNPPFAIKGILFLDESVNNISEYLRSHESKGKNQMEDIPDSLDASPLGLEEAYSVKTPDDNRRLYAKWAATYESSFVATQKYRYPQAISEVFHNVVTPSDVSGVVDIGTGTGLTGMYLSSLRPKLIIDGIDISPEMLAEAREKKRQDGSSVYRLLLEKDMSKAVSTPHSPYDALICSGTFTHGHLGPEAVNNLIALVRSNGWCVIGVNNEHFEARDFDKELNQLIEIGQITDLQILKIQVYEPGSSHYGDQARVLVFRVK